MPSISIHTHTLHELGLQALQQAIQTNNWPVEITFISRFRRTTQLFAIFRTCYTVHCLPLEPLPFRPLTHRAVLNLPPGIHHYLIVRAQSVIASGTLHVLPIQLPPTVTHRVPSTTQHVFAQPLPNAAAFTFAENIPRMSAVHLEIGSSNPRSIAMLKSAHGFTKKLPLSPGLHRYRFRVLFQPPLKRLTDIPLSRPGWNFSDSFRWGVATQWMTVQVSPRPPANLSSSSCALANHVTGNAADLHNTPLTTTTAAPINQLETLQCSTSPYDESSDISDDPLRIDTTLDGYSSEVSTSEDSDDIQHFSIFSSTSNHSTTNSSHSVQQSLSNDLFTTQSHFLPSSTSLQSSSTTSKASTRDLSAKCAALFTNFSEWNEEESVINALRITSDMRDVIRFADISSSPANVMQRDMCKSRRGSYEFWKFAVKNAEHRGKVGTRSWTNFIAIASVKAVLRGAMMAVSDGMMSRTKAKPD